MRPLIYPADSLGCGSIRLIWPAEYLQQQGADVRIEHVEDRKLRLGLDAAGDVVHVEVPDDADVVVVQRPTHRRIAQAVQVMRDQGVAVVVDIDDDLTTIHPDNVAWLQVHPDRHRIELRRQGYRDNLPGIPSLDQMVANLNRTRPYDHSYKHLQTACDAATLVTAATPRLLQRYARHGRGALLPNYLADHYFGHERVDSTDICWPASLWSHPNDPKVVGNALDRVIRETGADFTGFGSEPIGRAFGLRHEPLSRGVADLLDWPRALAEIGIGIAPLADTPFNASKSWLKPLELSAAGVPWVASPRVEYRRLHKLGAGRLSEKPGDWHRALLSLVRSAELRADLSGRGRVVADTLRLRDRTQEYWDAWQRARTLQDASPRPPAAASRPGTLTPH